MAAAELPPPTPDAATRAVDSRVLSPPSAAVAGIFTDRESAERAIFELRDAGFTAQEVGIAMRDRTPDGELVKVEDTSTLAAGGALSGAVGGGLLGGVIGLLVGIGALAVPGIGPVVAGGALASAFGLAGGTAIAGAGIGAAAGGVVGALIGLGLPEHEARYLDAAFRRGGVVVTVQGGARNTQALWILERHGAQFAPAAPLHGAAGAEAVGGRAEMEKKRTTDPEYPGRSDARYTSSVEDEPGGRPAHTAENAIGGAIIGGVPGALVGGPGGAVVGAAVGAAVGVATAEGADAGDEAGAAGDVANVENRGRRVKRDYEGHMYEEGSLADSGPGRNRNQI